MHAFVLQILALALFSITAGHRYLYFSLFSSSWIF